MSLKIVSTKEAPQAIGPYSQAIVCGKLLFTSGQIPTDPNTGNFAGDTIETQTEQSLKNIKAILTSQNLNVNQVIKTTVFLKNMNDFTKMNGVYERFFGDHKPARSTVEVARLPKDCLVEIECIASLE